MVMIKFTGLCIFFSFSFSAMIYAGVHTIFESEGLICKADLPDGWHKTSKKTKDKYITSLTAKTGAEIVLTAYAVYNNSDKEWENLQKRYSKIIAGLSGHTIEKKDLSAGKGMTSRILLFEYRSGGKDVLQRTLLMKNKGIFLTIECRAPVAVFGMYTEIFNRIMTDIDFTIKTKVAVHEVLEEDSRDENPSAENETADNEAWSEVEKNFPAIIGISDETRKAMKIELKNINELEKKGILERLE